MEEAARPPAKPTSPTGTVVGQPSEGGLPASASNVWDYVRVVYRHRWLALCALLLVAIPIIAWGFLQSPVYAARVRIVLDPEPVAPVSFSDPIRDRPAPDNRTQEQILRSHDLARRTIEALKLWEYPEFGAPRKGDGEKGPTGRSNGGDANAAALVEPFLARVKVTPIELSRLVDVVFEASDPKLAAAAVNALAEQFIQQDLEARFKASRQAAEWLEAQLGDQRKKVEQREAALQRYKEQQDALSVEGRQNIVLQKLGDLNAAVTRAETERLGKEAASRQVESAKSNPALLDSVPAIAGNANIQQLRAQLGDLQRQQVELAKRYGERHPDMIRIRAAIGVTERRLWAEIEKAATVVTNDHLAAVAQERSLLAALDVQKKEALRLNKQDLEYGQLQREADANRQIYNTLLQQARELGISSEFKKSSIGIIDRAEIPAVPVRPDRVRTVLLALAMGVFAAIGLALAREFLDPRIKTPQELQDNLRLPFIGLVPAVTVAAGERGPTFTPSPPSPFSQALRRIRTNLVLSVHRPGAQTLLVTSAAPREGKTTIAVGLARSFAAALQRVVVVDADLRRPRVHRLLGTDHCPGLCDFLIAKAEIADIVHSTNIQNLSVIPAGTLQDNPSELLGLPRMAGLLESLASRFDWIVLDSAPILSVPDGVPLARLCTGVLLVVGAQMASREDVRRAEEHLMLARAIFAGTVLNRALVERHSYYYAHYYNKSYESYYDERS